MGGLFGLDEKIKAAGTGNSFISEISLAELKFGVEKSERIEENREALQAFLPNIQIIPIIDVLDNYAKEKVRLRKAGTIIDEFDLLIAATAVAHNLIMVTNNTKHFSRIAGIRLEDWTKEK